MRVRTARQGHKGASQGYSLCHRLPVTAFWCYVSEDSTARSPFAKGWSQRAASSLPRGNKYGFRSLASEYTIWVQLNCKLRLWFNTIVWWLNISQFESLVIVWIEDIYLPVITMSICKLWMVTKCIDESSHVFFMWQEAFIQTLQRNESSHGLYVAHI